MTREAWSKRKFKQTNLPHHHYWEKTEITDKELWIKAYCAVANSEGATKPSTAITWADSALDAWKSKREYN